MIKLIPLAMRVPNSQGIYTLSKHSKPKKINQSDFIKYNGVDIKVSFHKDGISNPQTMTAYAYGMDCWYLAEFE